MRASDITWIAVREPAPSEDKYCWKNGYCMIRGRIWFGKGEGDSLAQTDTGERVETKGSAVFIKGKPIGIGWGVCAAVEFGESCDYRITGIADRGAYWRAELTGIPWEFRG
ncbi:hypothetical protein FACS1894184_01180 [Clostridia bacterium]|nr:hypothetical protein FACS1894184_01180 [Clostridia bacterium]